MTIYSQSQRRLINKIRQDLNEATSAGNSGGRYQIPLSMGVRLFDDDELQPYVNATSKFVDSELAYDSYDGEMSTDKKRIKSLEVKARNQSTFNKQHPNLSDDDGDILNNNPMLEADSSTVAGVYTGPVELGMRKWKKPEILPFTEPAFHEGHEKNKSKEMKNNISRVVGVWEKGSDGTYDMPTHDVHTLNEDLAVWFGKKKKPKGSKQPKGPWVNICRKVDGKHPPCGRPDADSKGYPKCRAAGVAGKMSDSEKRSACAQKRRAEKSDPKVGKGNKPTMTSYKPRNEEYLVSLIKKVLKEHLNGQ